jgi:dihydrofolate synthase/folylpolyglutamate synthase
VTDNDLQRVERELLERWPEALIDWTLDRELALLDLLGNPHLAYPCLHVAGTNGKTSTTRMAEALLRQTNLRTGRYTSPHLESMTERIAIDGQQVDPERFVETYDEIAPLMAMVDGKSEHPLSFFEALTGLAFAMFADAPVDAAVVEVGLGGRLDATNVVPAPVAVVTPIGLDHMAYLGDTLPAIAEQKAGIIKPGAFAVLAQQPVEAAEVLLRQAAEVGATVAREGLEFGVLQRNVAVGGQMLTIQGLTGVYDEVFLPLHGAYQAGNAACALAAVEAFLGNREPLDADLVRSAFAGVHSPGRLEVVRSSPTVLVDASHNPAGAQATAAALMESFSFSRLIGVVAVLGDKDARGILEAFEPLLAEVVVTQNSSPRAMPVDALAELAVDVFGENRVEVVSRLDAAIEAGVTLAEEHGELAGTGVIVTGSVVTAGDARHLLKGR